MARSQGLSLEKKAIMLEIFHTLFTYQTLMPYLFWGSWNMKNHANQMKAYM